MEMRKVRLRTFLIFSKAFPISTYLHTMKTEKIKVKLKLYDIRPILKKDKLKKTFLDV